MPVPHVRSPSLDQPLSLVAFSCEVWLHRLLADRNLLPEREYGDASWDAMLARITNSAETLALLRGGLNALRRVAETRPLTSSDLNALRRVAEDRPLTSSDLDVVRRVAEDTSLTTLDRDALRRVAEAKSLTSSDLNVVRRVAEGKPLTSSARQGVRLFIRALDDHLVRTRPERVAHLLSFYSSLDISTAADHDWVDPIAFFSAWAAGPTRSKYEVLDRGQQAAALVLQLGDGLDERLAGQARPASPYRQVRTLEKLLRETSRELIGVVSLPPSSGAAAATRHLATIGAVSLEEMGQHLFGDEKAHAAEDTSPSFGSVSSWRLPRVLTRIGEISQDSEVTGRVWGERRGREVVNEARTMLAKLLEEETPNINRPRSLLVEAYRYLDNGDPKLQQIVLARLERTLAVTLRDGQPVASRPFGDRGLLSTREQAYTALVLYKKNEELVDTVCTVLRGKLPRPKDFQGFAKPVAAARAYAAAYIEYLDRFKKSPPLDAFVSAHLLDADREAIQGEGENQRKPNPSDGTEEAKARVLAKRRKEAKKTWLRVDEVELWFSSTDGDLDSVRRPAVAVWQALRSGADACIEGGTLVGPYWDSRHAYQQRVRRDTKRKGIAAADDILASLPFHAREATRALVGQAVLSIDGTARREAVESLRQAGLAEEAARLFELVVKHCRSVRDSDRLTEQGHPLDWLREQAVFCLSYTGSLAGFDTLVGEAGLASGTEEDGWGNLPQQQDQLHSERWIRTTALLGLSELGDALHDDEGERAQQRIHLLLTRIGERLRQMSRTKPTSNYGDPKRPRREHQLRCLEEGEERRALVAVLAMLRSPAAASVDLLHVLSGRYVATADGKQPASVTRRHPWLDSAPPVHIGAPSADSLGKVTYGSEPVDQAVWDTYMEEMGPVADTWDLACWQLAEWGLTRIERRFRRIKESGGVRISDPLEASRQAERRMREYRHGRFAPPPQPRLR